MVTGTGMETAGPGLLMAHCGYGIMRYPTGDGKDAARWPFGGYRLGGAGLTGIGLRPDRDAFVQRRPGNFKVLARPLQEGDAPSFFMVMVPL